MVIMVVTVMDFSNAVRGQVYSQLYTRNTLACQSNWSKFILLQVEEAQKFSLN